MAKQPETVDRFEILANVTKDQLGHAMAALMTADEAALLQVGYLSE